MSRVLIWKKAGPGEEYDIFTPTDYSSLYDHVQKDWAGQSQNWGNKLWFQGIYSAIDNGENEYTFISDPVNTDEINSSFDFILLPMANIFYVQYIPAMRALTEIMERIRIPVYIIACGAQADSYDCLDELVETVGPDAKRFIRAIYNTGGDIALRGYFTKEFFNRLGFAEATVTGCPSLYQMGPGFNVKDKKEEEICPVFNGQVKSVELLMKEFPDSVFIDQSEYFEALYSPKYLNKSNLNFEMNFVQYKGKYAADFLSEGRIIMIADMNDWHGYLRNGGFNYSFGLRIHGTIMSLLSGIPSTIVAHDSRTREMAEFFNIPMVVERFNHKFTKEEMLSYYDKMSYDTFNEAYANKFKEFERFILGHGIVSHLNYENSFFKDEYSKDFMNAVTEKRCDFGELSQSIKKHMPAIMIGNIAKRIKNKLT